MIWLTAIRSHRCTGPRMADFALWVTACETAIWPAGTFWSAYCGNRDEAIDNVIESDPVAAAVRAMMLERTERTEWTGTASDLLSELTIVTGEPITNSKTWPNSARALSDRLRRAATFLRNIGINIGHSKEGKKRTRVIHITATAASRVPDNCGAQPSAPSASSAISGITERNNGFRGAPLRTKAWPTGASEGPTDRATVLTRIIHAWRPI